MTGLKPYRSYGVPGPTESARKFVTFLEKRAESRKIGTVEAKV